MGQIGEEVEEIEIVPQEYPLPEETPLPAPVPEREREVIPA